MADRRIVRRRHTSSRLGAPERLSARARRLVDAGENIVSLASYWEVVIKTQKRLLTISDLASRWSRAAELKTPDRFTFKGAALLGVAQRDDSTCPDVDLLGFDDASADADN